MAEPHPVVTPHETSAATSNGRSSSIRTQDDSLTTVRSENVPSAQIEPMSAPSRWNRNVPSWRHPMAAYWPVSQRFWCPVEQYRHVPQIGMNDVAMWSPTVPRETPAPTASTTPAPSCPPMIG